jgi:hypothetical protein
MNAAALRNAVFHEVRAIWLKLPNAARYYVILRLLKDDDPTDRDRIPSRVNGRRMSTEETLRRLALRRGETAMTEDFDDGPLAVVVVMNSTSIGSGSAKHSTSA